MTKPTYNKDDTVVIQKLHGGGTIKLVGKWAGDIIAWIKEQTLVNIEKTGHYELEMQGGVSEKVDQRSLKLDDPKKDKKEVEAAKQIMANIAPASVVVKAFKKAIVGKTITDLEYDQDAGLYRITIKKGTGRNTDIEFVNATIHPDRPKQKVVDSKDQVESPMTEGKFSEMLDLPGVKKNPNHPDQALIHCLLGNQSREIGRWRHFATSGIDNKQLKDHIREVFRDGKREVVEVKVGKFVHEISVKLPMIKFAVALVDDPTGNQEAAEKAWGSLNEKAVLIYKGTQLVNQVRAVLALPNPKLKMKQDKKK